MEYDSKTFYDLEKTNDKKPGNSMSNSGNILVPLWIRRIIQDATGLDRIVLDYGLNPVLWIGFVFWLIFILKAII